MFSRISRRGSTGNSIIFCVLLLTATVHTVHANPFAARAAAALTDQVMRSIQPQIAELAANAPVPPAVKAEMEQQLTDAARRIVQQNVQGAMGGRLPNPQQLAQQVLGELRTIATNLINAAATGAGVASAGITDGGASHGSPATAAATRPPSLIIVPVNLEQADEPDELRALIQVLHAAIGNTGAYAVLPPRATVVRAALAELESQTPGHTQEDKVKTIGAAVDAEYVLLLEMRTLGSLNMLLMQIYNAENGALVTGEILNYRAVEEAAEQLPAAAVKLTENAPRVAMSMPSQPIAPAAPVATQFEPMSSSHILSSVSDRKFSGGARFGTWLLNTFSPGLGLGSHIIMRDHKGGFTQTGLFWGGYLGGLMISAISGFDGDNVGSYIGIGVAITGVASWQVYNIIRSATYDRPAHSASVINDGLLFGALPDRNGNWQAVAVYNLEF